MKIKVKYFAGLRDITGRETETINVEHGITISGLLSLLYKKYPEMKKTAEIIVAKNRQYVEENERIEDGDEIALLPPVSGG
ncbi:MAG: molybdopterin converting factor subunit 1 [Thermoplasmata archaeon]